MIIKSNKLNVVIVSHRRFPNPIVDSLKKYLFQHFQTNLLDINHPLLDVKESFKDCSYCTYYESGNFVQKKFAVHWVAPTAVLYLKDVVYSVFWPLISRKNFDLYFGVGNLNPFAGVILKKIGRVKKVIYYSQDYFPDRFGNSILNSLYQKLDLFCAIHSDETWSVSANIIKTREKLAKRKLKNQYIVPGGIWFNLVKRMPIEKVNLNKIVYRGGLVDWQGVDLAISAMPYILKKIKKAKLEIVGDGIERSSLENLAKELGVEKNVIFHGLIEDRNNLEKIISDAGIGVATFNTKIIDQKVKNADPGKIKDYLVMGVPVITTSALSYHRKIVENRCGFVIKYDPREFANAAIELLSNRKLFILYRLAALKYIQQYDWCAIFSTNIIRVLSNK